MKIRGLKQFDTTRFGGVQEGRVIADCPEWLARRWQEAGLVEIVDEGSYDTKVVHEKPTTPRRRKPAPAKDTGSSDEDG
jgi:hypothetical protein